MGNCQQTQNLKENEIKIANKETGIFIAVKIWSKKSNELFNYEARTYKELKYDLMKQETLPKQLRHLFWRSEEDGLMIFNPNKKLSGGSDKQERSFLSKWVNLSSLEQNQGIEIKVNDVYKFGNTLLKVKDVFFQNHEKLFNNSLNTGQGDGNSCVQHTHNNKRNSFNSGNNASIKNNNQSSNMNGSGCEQQQKQQQGNVLDAQISLNYHNSISHHSCQRCQKICSQSNIGGNQQNTNNWIVMQKATTMMLSSKYQGTEEYNECLNDSLCESNCSQCIALVDQSDNAIANGENKQSNILCNHINSKKQKRTQHRLQTQGDNQKQCRICLVTEDEERHSFSAEDQMWQSIQKQTEEIINLPTTHQNLISPTPPNINHELHITQSTYNNQQTSNQQNNHCTSPAHNPNPMISICGCQGSMKYVHLRCLQTWVKSKQQLNDAFSSRFCEYYSQKAMICELCKKNYPLKININGQKIFLLQMEEEEEEEEKDSKQKYPASTASRQSNIISQGNLLQIDNEDYDEDEIANQEDQEDQNHPFQGDQDEDNEADNENDENDNDDLLENSNDNNNNDDDEDDNDDEEEGENDDDEGQQEEEQKTDWNNTSQRKKEKRKKKNKSFDNYVIFEISNSQNTSLNGLIILNLSKSYEKITSNNKTQKTLSQKKSSILKSTFTLGRQNSCDIKINDITVSRFHAELKIDYENGRVLLKDTNSKFGTLIKLRKELVINTKLDGVQVQINNVCLEFCIGQNPQQEFFKRQQKEHNQIREQQQSSCKFSSCCKIAQMNNNDNEIRISDSDSKYKDRYYHPINQLHDTVYNNNNNNNSNPQDFSFHL